MYFLAALPSSIFYSYIITAPDAKLVVTDIAAALVNAAAVALVVAPVPATNSTIGILIKFVPLSVNVCEVLGAVTTLLVVIVGFVSPTVTEPPKLLPEPFIVIELLANL